MTPRDLYFYANGPRVIDVFYCVFNGTEYETVGYLVADDELKDWRFLASYKLSYLMNEHEMRQILEKISSLNKEAENV